ncbi:DDE-type integrase/transposase/recombinase [Paraburkholderia youngii]|uniref:Transposase InsO family protein n=1 Tax=Paraburkholderia youngii TaxID=2782701 RepID=A0A7W8P1X4_9BURK|nr:DDE-type integrase/transposase/recombinase [Paraburkholderia youngii]MBB5400531.1 transposase InsO family protein [Paraburkholderia youngii]
MNIQLPISLPPISTWEQRDAQWRDTYLLGSAKPYTDEELRAAFDEWGTPEEGQTYILRSRKESPTRKFPGRGGNVISQYTSLKMKKRLGTESKNVEFAAVVHADFDGVTHELYCQPVQVGIATVIRRTSSRGRVTEYTHDIPCTPDLLRLTKHGPIAEEWKTEDELRELTKRHPKRFVKSEDGTWHCPEREAYFKRLGIDYCVRSSDEIATTFSENLLFLKPYFKPDARPLGEAQWSVIEAIVERCGAMSLAALLALAYEDETPLNENVVLPTPPGRFRIDDVHKAIAEQRLYVDLDYDELSDPFSVVVCSSPEQLELVKWRRPPPHAVSESFIMNVEVGTEFVFNKQPHTFVVTGMPAGSVLFRNADSTTFEEISDAQFQLSLFKGDIRLLSSPKTTQELLADCEYVSDERIAVARFRLELLRNLEKMDVPHGFSVRTLQRWRKRLRTAGDSQPLRLLALIPKVPGGARRVPQLTADVLSVIKEVALGANNPTNPLDSHSYETLKRVCEERSIKPCAKNTFYRRSALFRDEKAREGSRRAYSKEPAVWYLNRADRIHGGWPFARVHIDHTKLDIIIKVRGYGGRWYRLRPWLTIVMDAQSRAVLAFYLSAHPPSTVSCMMAMRGMVAIHKRVPDTIVCDNGAEFRSAAFDRFCDLNDITLDFRPAHKARFGGVIERLFGTTNTLLIHNLAGNTKATQHVRTLTRSIDPMRADHLGFVELHGLLEYFFFVEYNRERVHPAHDHTPEQFMHQQFMMTGRRLTRLRPYDTNFMLQTLVPVSTKGTRTVNPRMGVKIGPIYYWTDEFAALRHKHKEVRVFVDMWDVSVAYAVINGKWHRCISPLLRRFQKLTFIELRYALYEVRLRLKAAPEADFESVIADVFADHRLPPAAEATAATRRIYGTAGLAAIEIRKVLTDDCDEVPLTSTTDAAQTYAKVQQSTESLKPQKRKSMQLRSSDAQPLPSAPKTDDAQNEQSPFNLGFKVNYSSLPVRRPV